MAVRGTKDYLVGVDKMMLVKSHFVTSPDGVCFKRSEFETFNHGVGLFVDRFSGIGKMVCMFGGKHV